MTITNHWNDRTHKMGKGSRACRICNHHNGLIRKYGLFVCRQCFKENATHIGFKKYN